MCSSKEILIIKECFDLLVEAKDHLDYCGYGDSWERELAMEVDLPDKLEKFVSKYGEIIVNL